MMKTQSIYHRRSAPRLLSEEERRRRFERLRKLCELLDEAFRIPGTKIQVGLDGLIGLVPVIGDSATALISAYVIYEAHQLGANGRTVARMIANVGVDTLVGMVPVAGDFFDVGWKANKKNLRLLEADLARRSAKEARKGEPLGGKPSHAWNYGRRAHQS